MKVLWVSPRLIGPAASIVSSDYKGSSGNWIQSEFDELDKTSCQMYFLCGTRNLNKSEIQHSVGSLGEVYCVRLPRLAYGVAVPRKFYANISQIIKSIKPDIIHIWGTETCLQEAVVIASKDIPKVVFIQGIIGMHSRYRSGYINISENDYHKYVNLRRKVTKYIKDMAFKKQIEKEQSILSICGAAIVDNDFSRAYCYSFDGKIALYTRNLCAAKVFRDNIWSIENIRRHEIFTIYGSSADKGIHQLVKAVFLLKKEFNDVKLIIPGPFDINADGSLKITRKSSSFERWLNDYIKNNNLLENIRFIGAQTPSNMAQYIAHCNTFVCPSCMEVHCLSLREAMTVGAPCISSMCGSVREYVENGKNGFIYRYEEHEVLAFLIKKIFNSDDLASSIGCNARNDMMRAYTETQNESLLSIYEDVINRKL